MLDPQELKEYLDSKYQQYNTSAFIQDDPIQIPHRFTQKEDIEISGFLAATLAWGNRKMIINSLNRLMERMDNSPYDFVQHASHNELSALNGFVHRTFNDVDCTLFIKSLNNLYTKHSGLEGAFATGKSALERIEHFRQLFLSYPHEKRSEKHVSSPAKGSAAKRLNMFLRWMVRQDEFGVDFGLWKSIPTQSLMIPLDVHTGNVARALGLIKRKQNDWKALEELMTTLRVFDPMDPAKYDFALFGIGVSGDLKH
jgi:uncharacterized protein (TIGR02757 family)